MLNFLIIIVSDYEKPYLINYIIKLSKKYCLREYRRKLSLRYITLW